MIAHLLACTVTALVALAAALLLRGQRAAWRHAILFLALLRFAVPTNWLTSAGGALVRVAPARPGVRRAAEDLRWLLTGPGVSANTLPPAGRPGGLAYGALWLTGIAFCLAVWGRRALRRIPAVRQATGLENDLFLRAAGTLRVDLRIVAGDVVPGACGWWRPCVILPEELSAQLSDTELEAVLAHEVAHVRRRDNLIAAIAHAVVSVFWFHPLVWWMEHRMLAERETACDELVLAHGARAEDYVAGILKVCRMSFAGAAGYAGVTGSNLGNRMEYIMAMDLSRRSSRATRALLGTFFALAVALPVAGGYLRAQQKPPVEAPSLYDQKFQQGVDLLKKEKYAEAEQAFRDARQLEPANTRALMGQVEVKVAQKQYDEALHLLQIEVDRNPRRVDLRMMQGNTAVRARKYDEAIATFQKLLSEVEQTPNVAGDIHLRIGEAYRRKGDYQSAIASLRRMLELVPGSVIGRSTLALVLEAAGEKEQAIEEYKAALKLDPQNGVAMNNLAFLLSESGGDLDEALTMAQRARQLLPDVDEVSDTLGWIYLRKNLPEPAIQVFDRLVQKQPDRSTYRYHLAMGLYQKGDEFAAAEQLKAALKSAPGAEEAAKIRSLLQKIER